MNQLKNCICTFEFFQVLRREQWREGEKRGKREEKGERARGKGNGKKGGRGRKREKMEEISLNGGEGFQGGLMRGGEGFQKIWRIYTLASILY